MAAINDLVHDAWRALASGQCRLALLIGTQALERAEAVGDNEGIVLAHYWQAVAAMEIGNYAEALRHIMDSECADPPPFGYTHWRRNIQRFYIIAKWRPLLQDLRDIISSLRKYSGSFATPTSDPFSLEGDIHSMRGDWASALNSYSHAYREHRGDMWALLKHGFADSCAYCCIELGDFPAAEDWIAALEVPDEMADCETLIRFNQARRRLRLARARGSDIAHLRLLLADFEDASRQVEGREERFALSSDRLCVELLDPQNGDPETAWHPARATCGYRPEFGLDVHWRYEHNRNVLDFRLASLLYACGLAPIDSDFTPPPEQTLSCPASVDVGRRLHRARAALAVTYRHGCRIDDMLECSWRERELGRRTAWINAIAAASQASAPGSGL